MFGLNFIISLRCRLKGSINYRVRTVGPSLRETIRQSKGTLICFARVSTKSLTTTTLCGVFPNPKTVYYRCLLGIDKQCTLFSDTLSRVQNLHPDRSVALKHKPRCGHGFVCSRTRFSTGERHESVRGIVFICHGETLFAT
jgi:hypothetical protein